MNRRSAAAALLGALLGAACAADGVSDSPASPLTECRSGDREVRSEMACLQDDAACYQLASGNWCTGPRSATCPAGSTALAPGDDCPSGARCITISESLDCQITTD